MGNNIDLGSRFFTNTYITGSGRHNYLRIDELEDPLFTSFTLDIDYVSSPLFYTINNDLYGYPDNVEGMADRIEFALGKMYEYYMGLDQGYDILPALSSYILDGNKLGFGLQQNVYMDLPLYGATEYIYMVDKRNGTASQNDARFDNNRFVESGHVGYGASQNDLNSYKLGDSVKEIVNDSDRAWAENQKEQQQGIIDECVDIIGRGEEGDSDYVPGDQEVKNKHIENENKYNTSKSNFENYTVLIDGYPNEDGENSDSDGDKGYNETEILKKIEQYKKFLDSFEAFKKEIVNNVNSELAKYQKNGTNIYNNSECVKRIATWDDIAIGDSTKKDKYTKILEEGYGDYKELLFTGEKSYCSEFKKLFNQLKSYSGNDGYKGSIKDDGKSFILNENNKDIVRQSYIVNGENKEKFKEFGLLNDDGSLKGNVSVQLLNTPPDWATIFYSHVAYFAEDPKDYQDVDKMIRDLMSYNCDIESAFDENFTSDKIKQNVDALSKFERALVEVKTSLYGYKDKEVCDDSNYTPDSLYGKYMEAKETLENDDYTQAEKMKSAAESGLKEMNIMIKNDNVVQKGIDEQYEKSIQRGVQPESVSRKQSIVSLQTVLDMLGFISGMKKMTLQYPYIIQGVTGLDIAYNKHYGIKDSYLGSGEDKITITCLESLDLRVSSMFNRYFNAVYDRQYRRERVPVNLRRFNCSIYVHDVRNFVAKSRINNNGEYKTTYNRLLELTDMYFSVIEFRFFDCEIVPEETGNIFNDISNEAPSEMKKTNFTFTYGNCVVNFVPNSEVASH